MPKPRVLVTGGAGFIGFHVVKHFLRQGCDIVVVDDLSQRGASYNLKTLQGFGSFHFERKDIRSPRVWDKILKVRGKPPDFVAHLAARNGAGSSIKNPREDFEVNCLATFNLLEALR